jgi:GT2 family glycosyltransferase
VPRLGLAVPTYNRHKKLKRFLHNLTTQSFRDFTVYLADSGYNDKTSSDLQEYNEKIDLRIIPATPRHWWAATTNMAVKSALQDECALIMTINDDSVIKPDFLERMVTTFEKYKCRMLGARIDFADQPGIIWSLGLHAKWCDPELFGLDSRDYFNINEQALPPHMLDQEIVHTQGQCGDGLLIAADVFDEIGFYHEIICPQSHSDREFSLRAQQKGIKMWCTTRVVLYNDVYNDSESSKPNEMQHSCHGFIEIIKRLYSLYFRIKSPYYVWPVLYICLKYAPAGKKIRSATAFLKNACGKSTFQSDVQ